MPPSHELPDQPHLADIDCPHVGASFVGPLTGFVVSDSAGGSGAAAMIDSAISAADAQLSELGAGWEAVRFITIRLGTAEQGIATWEALVAPAVPDADGAGNQPMT